jgi:AraC family transcriptional regulator
VSNCVAPLLPDIAPCECHQRPAKDLAPILILLLETALREIETDNEAAKSTIARAYCLLEEATSDRHQRSTASQRLLGWQVRKVIQFIGDHLDLPIVVDDLGRLVGLSSSHFAKAFKRSFGEPPHGFIMRKRIERACDLLLSTDKTLSEVAVDCGLSDQSHLCRLFRRYAGLSPAAWRRSRGLAGSLEQRNQDCVDHNR